MKFKFIIIMLCLSSNIFSQYAYFSSTKYLKDNRAERYSWYINNQKITPQDSLFKIKVNYPLNDTIVFYKKGRNFREYIDTVFTRFLIDSCFVFTIGCCDDNYEISYSSKYYENIDTVYEDEDDWLKQRINSYTLGNLDICIININNDSIIVYPDMFVPPYGEGYLIAKPEKINSVFLYDSPYTNLTYDISIFQFNSNLKWKFYGNKIETFDEKGYSKLKLISKYKVRVFEGDHPTLIYDCSENKFSLNY